MFGTTGVTDAASAIKFLLAGNAYATFVSGRTGARFTYHVEAPKTPGFKGWFVSVLDGPDNTHDYAYLGCIFDDKSFRHGRKSRIAPDAESVRAFAWVWASLQDGVLGGVEVHHAGRCGRCGRMLTVPESVETGLGPECARKGRAA